MTRRREVSEQQIGEIVVAWLEALGCDVYQEVECVGGVADIVARRSAELWIVEIKTSFSIALLFQAMEKREVAHRIFIAAPYTRHMQEVIAICSELGVGVLEVHMPQPGWQDQPQHLAEYYAPKINVRVFGRRWNTRPVRLAQQIRPEHKTHAKAGAIGAGGRWTPFRDTCEQLARVVAAEPGITLKAAVEGVRHHYRTPASARGSLATWIKEGKVPGVALKLSPAGIPQLFPSEAKR